MRLTSPIGSCALHPNHPTTLGLPDLVSLSFSDQVCHDVALATEDAVRGREGEVCARQVRLSDQIQTWYLCAILICRGHS